MSKHNVEYLRRRGTQLRRLEQLPWPTNLFGQPVSIAELMAEGSPDHALQPTHPDGDEYDRIHDAAAAYRI